MIIQVLKLNNGAFVVRFCGGNTKEFKTESQALAIASLIQALIQSDKKYKKSPKVF